MARVQRGHIEAEMQGGGPDHEVLEGDGDTLGRLLALDLSGKLSDLQRDGMHDEVLEGSLGEDAPPFALSFGFGPVDAVCQLDDADGRERYVNLAMQGPRLAEDVFDGLATPFACDEDAGVEY